MLPVLRVSGDPIEAIARALREPDATRRERLLMAMKVAYVVRLDRGRPPLYRIQVEWPDRDPTILNRPTLEKAAEARIGAERSMREHAQLTIEAAIELYIAAYVEGTKIQVKSIITLRGRLLSYFEPALKLPAVRLNPELAYELYMGKVAAKLDENGKPIVLVPGLIRRPTKRPVGRRPANRPSRAVAGRYQVCTVCDQPGHNRRWHKEQPVVIDQSPEPVFEPPAASTHQAALREAKKFSIWLVKEGHAVARHGKHPLEDVAPYGHANDGGFGEADLTPEEQILLDRACVMVLETLDRCAERERLPWQQRAVAVLLCLRCGFRKGEILTARRRQFTILSKNCGQLGCDEDHGGHIAGKLQIVREHAKTGTSIKNVPIPPSLMQYVLPLLEAKGFEQFFLAGAPRGRAGGIGGANWQRDPDVGLADNWLNDALRKLCEIAGVRPENPHGLRGAFVDAGLREGDPFEEVAKKARHGNPEVTRRHYATAEALVENQQRAMAERLGYAFVSGRRAN